MSSLIAQRVSFAVLLIFATSGAFAVQGDPVPGVDVSIEQSPSGIKVAGKTDAKGGFAIPVKPGTYVVRIGGKIAGNIVVGSGETMASGVITQNGTGAAEYRRGQGVATGRSGGAY